MCFTSSSCHLSTTLECKLHGPGLSSAQGLREGPVHRRGSIKVYRMNEKGRSESDETKLRNATCLAQGLTALSIGDRVWDQKRGFFPSSNSSPGTEAPFPLPGQPPTPTPSYCQDSARPLTSAPSSGDGQL